MNERAYTVVEIDALRQACETRWLFGTTYTQGGAMTGRCYYENEKTKAVEEMVRTHMLAGHTAKDIYEADNPRQNELHKDTV